MHIGGKCKTQNRLWLSRKRRGLLQKQVAFILGNHTVDQVSRYEKGIRVPTLEVALALEIIYRVPLRLLFADLYREIQNEVRSKVESSPSLNRLVDDFGVTDKDNGQEFCTYQDVLHMPAASQQELERVRRHVVELARERSRRL